MTPEDAMPLKWQDVMLCFYNLRGEGSALSLRGTACLGRVDMLLRIVEVEKDVHRVDQFDHELLALR